MEFVFFLVFICTFKRFFCQDCRGNDGTVVCCGGYHWNSTLQSCQPCRIGFYGPNCSDACVYPGYGKDCQMECNCTILTVAIHQMKNCSRIFLTEVYHPQLRPQMQAEVHNNRTAPKEKSLIKMHLVFTRALSALQQFLECFYFCT
uniref:Uncharacterized protein LOC111105625 n=1 Tax=Crassostrea virginica TaxID=6565 RepID=A0A8B8AZE6_CRAVI|nr:uncharacterized protein LOC111105625 [Crassostrea virginica]